MIHFGNRGHRYIVMLSWVDQIINAYVLRRVITEIKLVFTLQLIMKEKIAGKNFRETPNIQVEKFAHNIGRIMPISDLRSENSHNEQQRSSEKLSREELSSLLATVFKIQKSQN